MIEYLIEYSAESLFDSKNAYIYYEIQLKGLGERFLKAIEQKINIISIAPQLYNVKTHRKFREAKVKGFPYLIVYRVYPKKKRIFVSAIHHTSRNPNKKYRK